MPIKTGRQYIESLKDGRTLHIDGKVVTDVTAYPPLQGIIGTIAGLYDDQHDPKYRDILTYRSPTTGDPVSKTYLEAKTHDELKQLAGCFHLRALRTFGLMGRHHCQIPHLVHEIFRHEDGEDPIHAVVGETLGRFVADDVGHARRHGGDLRRRSQVFTLGHG